MVAGSARVRSGLMRDHVLPWSTVRHRCCEPTYKAFASAGDSSIGYTQFHRSGMSRPGSPITMNGLGWMSRTRPVLRSYRVSALVAPA